MVCNINKFSKYQKPNHLNSWKNRDIIEQMICLTIWMMGIWINNMWNYKLTICTSWYYKTRAKLVKMASSHAWDCSNPYWGGLRPIKLTSQWTGDLCQEFHEVGNNVCTKILWLQLLMTLICTVNWKDMNPGRMWQFTVFVGPFFNIYCVNLKRPNKQLKPWNLNLFESRLFLVLFFFI